MKNMYNAGLLAGLNMSDEEKMRFANGLVAALNMPVTVKTQFTAHSATLAIPYFMDELAGQGMCATVGVNGCADIHQLDAPVVELPDDLTIDRLPKATFLDGVRAAKRMVLSFIDNASRMTEKETLVAYECAGSINTLLRQG